REFALQHARAAELQRRQWELAQAAERTRIVVAAQGLTIGFEQRRVLEQQRAAAQTQIVRDAQLSLKIGNFELGLRRLESAVALATANDGLVRELAVARAQAERTALADTARATAAREAALRLQQDRELATARQRIAEEEARRRAAEGAARKAWQARDQLAYQASFDEGRPLMSTGNYE